MAKYLLKFKSCYVISIDVGSAKGSGAMGFTLSSYQALKSSFVE